MKPTIPISECVHMGLYRLHSRNLTFGIYDEEQKGFTGIREKFWDRFLDVEYHTDAYEKGTAYPKEFLEMFPGTLHALFYEENFNWLAEKEKQYASTDGNE